MTENLPLVSIILPIHNEAHYIEHSLKAVLSQSYPPDCIEILIVDGMSTDGTREIVERIAKSHPSLIQIIDNPQQIVPTALNAALYHARGEIFIRIDGHCEIAPDYISTCVKHLQEENIGGVGGPITTIGETFLARGIAMAMSSNFGIGGAAFRTINNRTVKVDTVAFPAYPRKTIQNYGLFDEELVRNQDDEYNYRIRKHGGSILLCHDIRSKYYSRVTLGKLWKQYFQYGFWKVRVLQKHLRQMRPRQFAPPVFVLSLFLGIMLWIYSPQNSFLFFLICGAYLAANLLASIYSSIRYGWRFFLIIPIVYAILHISYGLGFLTGLIRFVHRWGDKQGNVPTINLRPST